MEPADERFPRGLRRGRQAGGLDLCKHEPVDPVPHPVGLLHIGSGRPHRRRKCPVRLVLGAFLDPAIEQLLLSIREPPVGVGRRHEHVGIGRMNPFEQRACAGIARHDRARLKGGGPVVEPQVGLPLLAVLPVAVEAVFRQNRSDIPIEVEGRGDGLRCESAIRRAGLPRQRSRRQARSSNPWNTFRGSPASPIQAHGSNRDRLESRTKRSISGINAFSGKL